MRRLDNIVEKIFTPSREDRRNSMVFVLNADKSPFSPCHPAVARKLLREGKAAVWRKYPFTIILKEQKETEENEEPKQEYRLKIDYGSRYTGIAILQGGKVIWLAVIEHRSNIKMLLDNRRMYRRRRRSANLRYRQARFEHRTKPEGWIPPSLQSRVDNIAVWVRRLRLLCPITHISYENCKFDTQLMRNAEISGVEYQQGSLQGYEVREYLLEKFNRTCCYCKQTGVPLEIEHIVPKSRGGTDRVDNLCISCHECNQAKGAMTAEEFGYTDIQKQVKTALKDSAIINATRWKVYDALNATGLPVECGSGARTKMNRVSLGLGKEHYLDACCVGASTPNSLVFKANSVLEIKSKGRGQHCRTNLDRYGFPRGYLARQKYFFDFQTGDMVVATVPKGKYAGRHTGEVLCRKSGSFDIKTDKGRITTNYRNCELKQRFDGYRYELSRFSLN
jgi:5-methylcytosine-specific restriction endonuclease McrA